MSLLPPEESAELLMICRDVQERMVVRGVYSRASKGTVPLGTLSCGELIALIRGMTLLTLQVYPEMQFPEVVEGLIRSAAVREAGGSMN